MDVKPDFVIKPHIVDHNCTKCGVDTTNEDHYDVHVDRLLTRVHNPEGDGSEIVKLDEPMQVSSAPAVKICATCWGTMQISEINLHVKMNEHVSFPDL